LPAQPTNPRRFVPRSGLRRDLWVSTADAAAFSVMVGCGEAYFPAFTLALGLGPVAAGMVASVPILAGAVFQLVTPLAVSRLRTNRGWVVACTMAQSLSFAPLIWWALRGRAELWELLVAASLYWAAGMAGVPAWNSWIGTLVPERMRTQFITQRNRLGQFGVFIGFVVGGLLLQAGEKRSATLTAFAVLFTVAGICRLVSTGLLVACRELVPPPPRGPAPDSPASGLPPANLLRQTKRALGVMATSPSGALIAFLWCFTFGTQFAAPYYTPYMLREIGFSYGTFMLVVATGVLAKALALPAVGRLGSRIGSIGLLWVGSLSVIPLALLWLPSANVGYLVGVQLLGGTCWSGYELAVALLFFDAVPHRERTGVLTAYNLGLAIATVAGAAAGGVVLRSLGEDRTAYATVFTISSLLRLAAIPLLRRVRHAGR
jgi:MFS family permease